MLFFLLIISYLYLNRVEQLNEIKTNFSQNESDILQLINFDNKIKIKELKSAEFYTNTNNEVLKTRNQNFDLIQSAVDEILYQLNDESLIDIQQIKKVKQLLYEYDSLFNFSIQLSLKRGFKDFGLIGEMRKQAHLIEDSCNEIKAAQILMLRRHEKDFLLRGEDKYPKKFNQLIDEIIATDEIKKSKKASSYLKAYQASFNQLVQIEVLLGANKSDGIMQYLDLLTNAISLEYSLLAEEFKISIQQNLIRLRILYTVSCLIILILSLILSYSTSNKLAKPIQKLSKKMNDFIL